MKVRDAACGAGVMALLIAPPVHVQEPATLSSDGKRPHGGVPFCTAAG